MFLLVHSSEYRGEGFKILGKSKKKENLYKLSTEIMITDLVYSVMTFPNEFESFVFGEDFNYYTIISLNSGVQETLHFSHVLKPQYLEILSKQVEEVKEKVKELSEELGISPYDLTEHLTDTEFDVELDKIVRSLTYSTHIIEDFKLIYAENRSKQSFYIV